MALEKRDSEIVTFPFYDREGYECGALYLLVTGNAFRPSRYTEFTTRVLCSLPPEVVKGADVVDVGCGVGPLGLVLKMLGARYVLMADIDRVALQCARENVYNNLPEKGDSVEIVRSDMLRDVPAERHFKLAVANLFHVSTPVEEDPRRVALVGKKGARLIDRFIKQTSARRIPYIIFPQSSLLSIERTQKVLRKNRYRPYILGAFLNPFPPLSQRRLEFILRTCDSSVGWQRYLSIEDKRYMTVYVVLGEFEGEASFKPGET